MLEAVAPVNIKEIVSESQSTQDGAAEVHRLIRQHRQLVCREIPQGFTDAIVSDRVIQHMLAVVGEKNGGGPFDVFLSGGFAQGAADQHCDAASDVGGDHLRGKRSHTHALACGVNAQYQVNLAVN